MNSNKKKTIKQAKKNLRRVKRQVRAQRIRIRRTRRQVNRKVRRLKRNINQNKILRYKEMQERFKIERSKKNTMVVSGTDLVYKVPDVFISTGHKIIAVIPCNPAYWKGTRIATLATCYSQYRPLRFTVHYNPTLSAMDRGVVFAGAVTSNQSINPEYLEQTMATAPGNMNTQVAKPKSVSVPLGPALSKRLFNVGGDLDEDSNPFYYVGVAVGNFNQEERITPGYFWISYKFLFKNPLVSTSNFYNSGLTTYDKMSFKTHTSLLVCEPFEYEVNQGGNIVNKQMNYFAQLQIDRNNTEVIIPTYEDTYIPLKPDTKVWIFQSETTETQTLIRTITLPYANAIYDPEIDQPGTLQLRANLFYLFVDKDPFRYRFRFAANTVTVDKSQFDGIYRIAPNQIDVYCDVPWDSFIATGNVGTNVDPINGDITAVFLPTSHEDIRLILRQMDANKYVPKLIKLSYRAQQRSLVLRELYKNHMLRLKANDESDSDDSILTENPPQLQNIDEDIKEPGIQEDKIAPQDIKPLHQKTTKRKG